MENNTNQTLPASGVDALQKHDMKVRDIVMIVFCLVAAGAFGIEEAIPTSGPGLTLLLLLLFPIIWAMPLCLQIAELGSIMPNEGGVYNWIKETLGEFWGWQAGFWSGVSTWLSEAEFITLAVSYLQKFVEMNDVTAFALKVVLVIIFCAINLRGIEEAALLDTIFTILVLIGFGAVMVVGFTHWNYNPVQPFYNEESGLGHSIGDSVAILLWMFCGYECVSNMAQEVKDPQIIPKGLILAQPVIAVSYILPVAGALVAIGNWENWSTETGAGLVGYMDVLTQCIGPWAGLAFVIIAVVSNLSIFNAYIQSGSRVFFVLADDYMFPRVFTKVNKRGVPNVSIIAMGIVAIICCLFDFKTLVLATTPLQMFLYMMMAVSIYKLRKTYPVEWRKEKGLYVIPGGKIGLLIMIIPTFVIAYLCCYLNGAPYFIAVFIMVVISLALYIIIKRAYKGEAVMDPEGHPLNERTKLGLGDTFNIGLFTLIIGLMSIIGSGFLQLYEGSYGAEYYLEIFETGFFSDFNLMIKSCLVIGIVLVVIGGIMVYFGKKNEIPKIKELENKRKKVLDEKLCKLHGWDSIE